LLFAVVVVVVVVVGVVFVPVLVLVLAVAAAVLSCSKLLLVITSNYACTVVVIVAPCNTIRCRSLALWISLWMHCGTIQGKPGRIMSLFLQLRDSCSLEGLGNGIVEVSSSTYCAL